MFGFLFPDDSAAPEGLKLLYVAPTIPEAEMLSQVLIEAGYHIEYVPGVAIVGAGGNRVIYIPDAEYDSAAAFLKDYLAPSPQEPAEESGGSGDQEEPKEEN